MFQTLPIFATAHAMAQHAGHRQTLIAENMANSDTPGFVPRDLPPFANLVPQYRGNSEQMRSTRTGHLGFNGPESGMTPFERPGPSEPNGNAVSLEDEMLNAIETTRQHDRALAVYRSAMTVLRLSIGRN